MTDKQFIQTYPLSIKAWQAQLKPEEFVITGDEKMFYDFQVSEYAYWFNINRNEELYDKIKELEAKLTQQQFNNNHNLSIDQTVADRIEDLEKKLLTSEEINRSLANRNDDLNNFCKEFVYGEENPEYYKTMDEKLKIAVEALEFYGETENYGTHAREALLKIKQVEGV